MCVCACVCVFPQGISTRMEASMALLDDPS